MRIILSLFDGGSCGQVAANIAGVKYGKYYAAEIDEAAKKVTSKKFPDTIHLGDVTKWREWDLNWAEVDLLLGGSPCQGFSFAGKRLNFDDPRSALFFVFVDIWRHIKTHNPKALFLFENVMMAKKSEAVISEYLDIFPVEIDAERVSACRRRRLFWSNIRTEKRGLFDFKYTNIPPPPRVDIKLEEVIDMGPFLCSAKIVGRYVDDEARRVAPSYKSKQVQCIEPVANNSKLNCISTVTKDYVLSKHKKRRLLSATPRKDWRYLTPEECEKLMGLPVGYTSAVSKTQRHKIIGNGWSVPVIVYIFSFIKPI